MDHNNSSNFAFLQAEWGLVFEAAQRAESAIHSDARASCFYARRALELAVDWLFKHDAGFKLPYQDNLSALIHEPSFRQGVGDALFTKARLIKDLGNLAVHSTKKVAPTDALTASRELFHVCYWLARTYGRGQRPEPGLSFQSSLVPAAPGAAAPASSPQQSAEQLQKLGAQLQEKDQKLSEVLSKHAVLDAELQQLRAQVAAAKQANAQVPDTHDYSEAETRKAFIDLLLREAGWALNPAKNFEVAVQGMPNNEGKGFVDYVLWGDDGKPLMLVEAKRTTKSPLVGQQQAKLYADGLEAQFGQRPVIFCSNGYEHWMWDDLAHPPRPVQGFYKKDELLLLMQRRGSRKPLAEAVINGHIVERYYQTRAVRRVGAAFEVDHQRKALLVMATGSGKTRTVIALVDLLIRCNWAKRVLFLADRVALVNQAVNAFKTHLPDSAPVNLVTDKATEGRVFVSTYPTMMGLIDEDFDFAQSTPGRAMGGAARRALSGAEGRRFGVGHFDLIVIDEAHRSVYQKYGAIFRYFDSLLVGLTATPKDEVDHNTYGLFELEDGVPTDAYDLDQAVADKHLVPPVAISVPLKFQREGIKYAELSDEDKAAWDELDWNEDGSTPDEVSADEVNKWLFNLDTVDKVLEVLMTQGQRVAGGDRLGKTIVFAKNNDHAAFIEQRFNANYPEFKGHFARVVTYKTEYAQSLIDDFSKKEKMPHIAISVDMLDTGIDVPEVVNLVFFKLVRSKTKFWQMLGRGTRLCPDLFAPGEPKQNFFVFDFCQNLEYFSQNPAGGEGATAESLTTRLFKARLDLIGELDTKLKLGGAVQEAPPAYGGHPTLAELRDGTAALLHERVAHMNVDNFVVRPQRQFVERYAKAEAWQALAADDHEVLAQRIAGLPSQLSDEDEEAKRFDMLVLRAQLSMLQARPDFATLRQKIQTIASKLEDEMAIPTIKAEALLIQAVASDEWWEDVTVPMLETARKRLRALVKLLPKGEKKVVYTDFEDEVGDGTVIDLPQVTAGLNMAKFKDKARAFLREHESHLALQRLRRNQALTPTDLDELENMLRQAGATDPLLVEAKSQGLGLFIRSLVGLERDAAMQAFSELLQGGKATPEQIEFLELVIDELTQNGVMPPERLFESPFTDVSAKGPLGVFPPKKVTQIVSVLNEIQTRAAA
jgi:type I restriction enzyme R subunit